MHTVRDLLVRYNNLHVDPFLRALQTQESVYSERSIDMFKDAISLLGMSTSWMFSVVGNGIELQRAVARRTGVARQLLYAAISEAVIGALRVQLIDVKSTNLHALFKEKKLGRPSLVFHYYHEHDITRIRPDV